MMRRPGFCSPTAPMPCPLRERPLCAPRSILSPICQGSLRLRARVFAAAKTTKNPIKGFLVLAACYFVVRRNSGEPPLPYCAAALGNRTKAGCVHPGKESMAVRTPDQREYGCPDTGLPRPFSRPRRGQRDAGPILPCGTGQARCLGCHTLFSQAGTTSQGKDSMAVRPPDLPCAKGAVGERRLRD